MTDNITLPRATVQQALEALIKAHPYSNSNKDLDGHSEAITALRAALEQPKAMQIRPSEFIRIVEGKEAVTGIPVYWAEWPNKESV